MSGVDLDGRHLRKGAADADREASSARSAAPFPDAVRRAVEAIARAGATPLVVADDTQVLGVIELKDIVKGGIQERFARAARAWASRR